MVSLAKKITDYGQDDQGGIDGNNMDGDDYGVAVVFDEEEEGSQDFAIGDSDVESDGEGGDEAVTGTVCFFFILLV